MQFAQRLLFPLLHKAASVIALIYVFYVYFGVDSSSVYTLLLNSIMLIFGIGALGYLMNDWTDRKEDLLSQKFNLFNNLSSGFLFVIISVAILTAVLPWCFLYFDQWSFILLILELFLFYAYAFKPIRLKEKQWWGLICDSLYARVIPLFFAGYTFFHFLRLEFISNYLVLIFVLWSFLLGIRNILTHQIEDASNDLLANTKTLPVLYGISGIKNKIWKFFLLPEILLFIGFLYFISPISYLFPAVYGAYLLAYSIKKILFNQFSLNTINSDNPDWFYHLNENLTNEFYEKYFPLLLIAVLCWRDPYQLFLLIVHLSLFRKLYFK